MFKKYYVSKSLKGSFFERVFGMFQVIEATGHPAKKDEEPDWKKAKLEEPGYPANQKQMDEVYSGKPLDEAYNNRFSSMTPYDAYYYAWYEPWTKGLPLWPPLPRKDEAHLNNR